MQPRPSAALKKNLEREDQYLYVVRRTFTNLFLARTHLNLLRAVPDLTQLSLESIYL
jgi:hypothetical protein